MQLIGRKLLVTLIILTLLSPICGVILADLVGYHEPLDVAAETIGLEDISEQINWTPLFDYGIEGIPAEIGYIISGFIGLGIILGVGYLLLAGIKTK